MWDGNPDSVRKTQRDDSKRSPPGNV